MSTQLKQGVYDIRLHRDLTAGEKDCDGFHSYVKRAAQRHRELRRYTASANEQRCNIELEVCCPTTGTLSINRFRRAVELNFPNVVFGYYRCTSRSRI